MRTLAAALVLVIVGLGFSSVRPAGVTACSGVTLDFADAVPMSDGAIYAGRITRTNVADTFWVDMAIDVDRVVRGPAAARVPRAQAGHVCDGIRVGEYGYIVRGVLNPEHGPERQDLFFRVSQSDARAALIAAGLPDTSTAADDATRSGAAMPWTWLAVWLAAILALVFAGRRRHRRGDTGP